MLEIIIDIIKDFYLSLKIYYQQIIFYFSSKIITYFLTFILNLWKLYLLLILKD
jgi:hypothetical protein